MWFAGGGVYTWKATAEETGWRLPALRGPDGAREGHAVPLPSRAGREPCYVLDGEILVNIEGEEHAVGAGGLAFAPRGVPHAFKVTSESARVLALQTPGTGESFYRECSQPAQEGDENRPPDWALLRRVAETSDCIEILGPAPFG